MKLKAISLFKCFLISILIILFPLLSGTFVTIAKIDSPMSMLIQAGFMLIAIIIAIIIMLRKKIKLTDLNIYNSNKWIFFIPCLLFFISSLVKGFTWHGFEYFFFCLLLYLFVGIAEELYFRLFIPLTLKKEFNTRSIIIISTLFFGLGHCVVAFNNVGIVMTLLTILNALLFGLVAIELLVLTNKIVPIMIIHFIFDFESKFIVLSGNGLMIAEIVRGTLMAIYGIILYTYIIRKKK